MGEFHFTYVTKNESYCNIGEIIAYVFHFVNTLRNKIGYRPGKIANLTPFATFNLDKV